LSVIRMTLSTLVFITVFYCWVSADVMVSKPDGLGYTDDMVKNTGLSKPINLLSTDTTSPEIVFDQPSDWQTSSNGQPSIVISGTATDDTGVVSISWKKQTGESGSCNGTDSWSSSPIELADGENLVSVSAEDNSGNVGTSSVSIDYDPNGPTLTITVLTTEYIYTTSDTSLTVDGTASGDYPITDVAWNTNIGDSGKCVGTVNWNAADIPLSVGDNTLLITATDSQGNCGSSTLYINVTDPPVPDLVKPEVTIVSPTLDLAQRRIGSSVTVTGTASDNIALKTIAWATDKGYKGTCTGTTSWSIAQLPLDTGENRLEITATDTSDNVNTAQLTITRQQTTVAEAWQGLTIAALPMVPDIIDPKLAVGFTNNSWASYDTDLGVYHAYPDVACWLQPSENTPGRGFWGAFAAGTQDPLGYATPLNSQVDIHLYPGWNLVGNPYNATVNWEPDRIKIRVAGSVDWVAMSDSTDSIRDYAIGWQQNPANPLTGEYYPIANDTSEGVYNYMAPWRAVWIKAFVECDLLFPPPIEQP